MGSVTVKNCSWAKHPADSMEDKLDSERMCIQITDLAKD